MSSSICDPMVGLKSAVALADAVPRLLRIGYAPAASFLLRQWSTSYWAFLHPRPA